jgi:4-hydroxybenzoate polyprenyltransferase
MVHRLLSPDRKIAVILKSIARTYGQKMGKLLQFVIGLSVVLVLVAANSIYGSTGAIIVGAMLLTYFLPSLIVYNRKPNNWLGVFALNIFLGWSFLGWVIALVWACSGESEVQQQRRVHDRTRP